jgi:hypothetical protein
MSSHELNSGLCLSNTIPILYEFRPPSSSGDNASGFYSGSVLFESRLEHYYPEVIHCCPESPLNVP